jgi:hypothetical protein
LTGAGPYLSRAQDLSGPFLPFLYSFPPRKRCNLPERIRSQNPFELGK